MDGLIPENIYQVRLGLDCVQQLNEVDEMKEDIVVKALRVVKEARRCDHLSKVVH